MHAGALAKSTSNAKPRLGSATETRPHVVTPCGPPVASPPDRTDQDQVSAALPRAPCQRQTNNFRGNRTARQEQPSRKPRAAKQGPNPPSKQMTRRCNGSNGQATGTSKQQGLEPGLGPGPGPGLGSGLGPGLGLGVGQGREPRPRQPDDRGTRAGPHTCQGVRPLARGGSLQP